MDQFMTICAVNKRLVQFMTRVNGIGLNQSSFYMYANERFGCDDFVHITKEKCCKLDVGSFFFGKL